MSENDPQAAFPAELASLSEFRFRLRQFLNFSEAASDRVGIQAQQYQLMQVVAAVPADEQASISYLAERMVLRHNSTVELVDRAEKANLVARHSDPKDLRRSIVKLTPQGESIFRQLLNEHIREARRVSDELTSALQSMKEAMKANQA